ncbi:putative starch [bacterial glycogen] synthase [Gemella bergeri ATCC 700627]|uniref:Glycogen synthase n=1 Tax=Gemella bergeri ATCC 700627 TaxID=1321820 RepID=U2QS09_9BACL|nr:glycogen synthase GlgA [Gemella bergeri]ERK58979.1 putative starch [bacterial glycogen] synthase [Gemella bergeri ATCC 700627]
MKVLFVAAEAAPFVKVGGLGDVIGSLPKALQDEGVEARVILPLYTSIDREKFNLQYKKHIFINLGWRKAYCGIFETEIDGVKFYFIDNEQYFNRSGIYGQDDDGERFAFFSKAALEILPHIEYKPDVLNANDWHTALSIIYLDDLKSRGENFYNKIKSVISIHNIEFQGIFNPYDMRDLFGLDNKYFDALIYNGNLNLLKGAIQLADRINTVSETYSHEILEPYFSYGLDSILRVEQGKLHGIVNGIDIDKFNPKTDKQLYKNYDLETIKNKVQNKLKLQEEMSLEINENIPMIGMVTRLTHQKGIDLLLHVADEILKCGAQLIILGTGDSHYEEALHALEFRRHDKVRSLIMFSGEMSAKIYGACDMFLMPSKTEPCGLSQMISMRYGTVPIVHRVGGLRDTVEPFNGSQGTGFTFETFDAYDMLDAIYRATYCYYQERYNWNKIIKNAMQQDVSWKKSAVKYLDMYKFIV